MVNFEKKNMRKVRAFSLFARFVLLNVSSTNVFDSGQDKLSTDWWCPLLSSSFAVEGGSQGLACSLFPLPAVGARSATTLGRPGDSQPNRWLRAGPWERLGAALQGAKCTGPL